MQIDQREKEREREYLIESLHQLCKVTKCQYPEFKDWEGGKMSEREWMVQAFSYEMSKSEG